jgi:hypothetical protein
MANVFNFYFQNPSFVWSEEYQVELMAEHFKAFDILRSKKFFIGEMIWNFADFKTEQSEYISNISILTFII